MQSWHDFDYLEYQLQSAQQEKDSNTVQTNLLLISYSTFQDIAYVAYATCRPYARPTRIVKSSYAEDVGVYRIFRFI